MRLWERCSELLGARICSRYLTAKWTGRRWRNHQSLTRCLKNLRLRKNRRNMNPRSLVPVLGQWHPNLRACIQVCPHVWQPLSWVLMRPWTYFSGSWVQAMITLI